jgi:hypothetical protein
MVALNQLTTLQQVSPSRIGCVTSRRTVPPLHFESTHRVDDAGDYQLKLRELRHNRAEGLD